LLLRIERIEQGSHGWDHGLGQRHEDRIGPQPYQCMIARLSGYPVVRSLT